MKVERYMLCIGALLAVLLVGCEDLGCDLPGDQPVYFEYHYTNHAWGYHENGWIIDREGNIRSFNLPVDFRSPDSTGYLTIGDLEHNLALTDSIVGNVDEAELEQYIEYIPAAAEGEIGKSKSIAADAGASVLSCYFYDKQKDVYKYVFLAQSGDWEQFNLSPEAEILVDWLLNFDVFWLSD
jgi:hypothetical protein